MKNYLILQRHVCNLCMILKVNFSQDQKLAMNAFKAACLFSPSNINFMQPTPSDISELSVFPFLLHFMIEELKKKSCLFIIVSNRRCLFSNSCYYF